MEKTKFDILYEEVKSNIINEGIFDKLTSYFKKTWSLKEEFEILLPFIIKKIENSMANFYETGMPGPIDLIDAENIEEIDEGSSEPGFKVTYSLLDDYVKYNLLPCLLKNPASKFVKLNKKYDFENRVDQLDTKLVIILHAHANNEIDLAKPDVQIKKLSIKKWNGDLYVNFDCPNIPRDKSNISIGTINLSVDVSEYGSLTSRILKWIISTGANRTPDKGLSESIAESFRDLFGGRQIEKTSRWDKIKSKSLIGNIGKIPGATVKCTVNIDKSLKKQHELDVDNDKNQNLNFKNPLHLSYSEDICNKNDILSRMTLSEFEHIITYAKTDDNGMQLSNDITDTTTWESAENTGENWRPTGNAVTAKTDMACGMIDCALPEDLHKYYYIYININDWKNNKFNNKQLWLNNSVDPIINIQIKDANTDDIVYSRWYDLSNFKEAEPRVYKLLQNKLNTIKPLS